MKHRLFCTSGIIVCGAVMLAGGSAQAQITGPGPYYATPSWDQRLQCDTKATCPRFLVLLNWNSEAVLDRETGLVWEKSPDKDTLIWFHAQQHCMQKMVANRKGWRLPTIQELASLLDLSQWYPALPAGHPFTNVKSVYESDYWSATANAFREGVAEGSAWEVDIASGGIWSSQKLFELSAWCVRSGGQGVDSQ